MMGCQVQIGVRRASRAMRGRTPIPDAHSSVVMMMLVIFVMPVRVSMVMFGLIGTVAVRFCPMRMMLPDPVRMVLPPPIAAAPVMGVVVVAVVHPVRM